MSLSTCVWNRKFSSYTVMAISLIKKWRQRNMNKDRKELIGKDLFVYPKIQQVIIISYNKYDFSISKSHWEILYEKLQNWMHGEKIWAYTGNNKQEKAEALSQFTTCHCQLINKIWTFFVTQLWRYLWRKILRERKENKYREAQIGEGTFSILRYNFSLSTCIPNMEILS